MLLTIRLPLLVTLILALSACGGGSGGPAPAPAPGPAPTPVPPVAPPGLYLVAGPLGGQGNVDGAVGRFMDPRALAVTPTGVLHVSDFPSVRTVTQLAGGESQVGTLGQAYSMENGVVFDAAGNRYTADLTKILRTAPGGTTTTFAGSDQSGSADATGAAARFSVVRGLAIDASGNLYASDIVNHSLRKITPAGVVTTLASLPGAADAIAADATGNVYAAFDNEIHRYDPSGARTVVLAADSTTPGRLAGVGGMVVGKDGNIYLAEGHGCAIRKLSPAGVLSNFVGKSAEWGSADGVGEQARFCEYFANGLRGLVTDAAGNLYVSDRSNATIRKITLDGTVTTIAGRARVSGHVDGTGSAVRFDSEGSIFQLAADAQGSTYVREPLRIRKVLANGQSSTLGLPTTGTTGKPVVYAPGQLASGGRAIAFSDGVLSRVDANGNSSFLAGQPGVLGNADGTGAQATFRSADRIVVDGLGNTFLVDSVQVLQGTMWFPKSVYRKVSESGVVSTLPDLELGHWAALPDGGLVVVRDKEQHYDIERVAPDGSKSMLPVAREGDLTRASAVAVDRQNNIYVAEFVRIGQADGIRIRRITPAGVNSIVAGQAGSRGIRTGALPASLNHVEALTVGADGALYLISENSLLRIVL